MLNKVLAVAVVTGRVGFVYIEGGTLADCAISRKAARSADATALRLRHWIRAYKPEIVITERLSKRSRKGERAKELTRLLAVIASYHGVYDVTVELDRDGRTIFEQAKHLLAIYPDIEPRMIARRCFYGPKDQNTTLFDALTLAHTILRNPTIAIAANMDGDGA